MPHNGIRHLLYTLLESGGIPRNMSLAAAHSAKYRNNKNYPFHKKYKTSIKEVDSTEDINEIAPEEVIIPKELIHGELNDKLWVGKKLNPIVRKKLLRISKEFYENLGIKTPIKKIYLIGSMANYNWSSKSDIDLHIFFDYSKISENIDLVNEFFWAKKGLWNLKHNIKIKGFDVEIYCNNIKDKPHSAGIFDIYNNKWVNEPTKENFSIDKNSLQTKTASLINQIEEIEEDNKMSLDEKNEKANNLRERLAKMRQSGLEQGGEFSIENLSFKYLRNNGYMERLINIIKSTYDEKLSLK